MMLTFSTEQNGSYELLLPKKEVSKFKLLYGRYIYFCGSYYGKRKLIKRGKYI